MTMHTRYPLVCSCGNKGSVKMTENDQPYSRMYESYSLEGFNGGTCRVDGYTTLQAAIEQMRPICPKCGADLTVANLIND